MILNVMVHPSIVHTPAHKVNYERICGVVSASHKNANFPLTYGELSSFRFQLTDELTAMHSVLCNSIDPATKDVCLVK